MTRTVKTVTILQPTECAYCGSPMAKGSTGFDCEDRVYCSVSCEADAFERQEQERLGLRRAW